MSLSTVVMEPGFRNFPFLHIGSRSRTTRRGSRALQMMRTWEKRLRRIEESGWQKVSFRMSLGQFRKLERQCTMRKFDYGHFHETTKDKRTITSSEMFQAPKQALISGVQTRNEQSRSFRVQVLKALQGQVSRSRQRT